MSAIVLLSGGQDSATCLAIAKQVHTRIHCICFNYDQRHNIEIDAARLLAEKANASFQLIDISFLKTLSSSAMIHKDQPITHNNNQLPSTFVPGRNALFLTVAGMVAYEKGMNTIYTGVCQTDYSGYPDCREQFIQSQTNTINLAMELNLDIRTPLMHLTKSDTVKKMIELNRLDWYSVTHTCYEGKRPACGVCPACKLRLKGFAEAGVDDLIEYEV